jgi:predicted GNAT superfamily acetyltransferase
VSDGNPAVTSSLSTFAGTPTDIRIRPAQSLADFHACVELQEEVWGPEWTDTVPSSLLQAATYVGGIVLGAFMANGELAGFLFGLTGVENGEITHWSHMLGVRATARDMGVGRMLKEAQRAELARRNIRKMSWSFDPLVAKNAHLNVNRLGARVVQYVPDMYGTTSSPLHYGIATDRLVVTLETMAPKAVAAPSPQLANAPVLALDAEARAALERSSLPRALRIEVPSDIRVVLQEAPERAAAWRTAVRDNFQWALAKSYEVAGLYREPVTSRSFYTLVRQQS